MVNNLNGSNKSNLGLIDNVVEENSISNSSVEINIQPDSPKDKNRGPSDLCS